MIMMFNFNLSKQCVMKAVQVLIYSGFVGERKWSVYDSLDVVALLYLSLWLSFPLVCTFWLSQVRPIRQRERLGC